MPTAIVYTPHPDDEAYAFGGIIARLTDARWDVYIEVATAGEQGERHDGGPADARSVGIERLTELAFACSMLRAKSPHCWGLPDGGLREYRDQAPRIMAHLLDVAPELVLTLGPDGAYGHPDHLALHRWVTGALDLLGDSAPPALFAAFSRGLFIPQWELCKGMMGDPPSPAATDLGGDSFDLELDITAVAARKQSAIAAHRTQLPGGDPNALFPPGIVELLLRTERFTARGPVPAVLLG